MRLIDADALEQKIRKTMYGYKAEMEIFLTLVDMQQTIEAAPVVHGKYAMFSSNLLSCSVCGDVIQLTEKSNFCPNCGAKMKAV